MKKILISGYYGFGNIGDEAILKAMVSEFSTMEQEIDLTVLSQNPEQTKELFGVKAEDRSHIFKVIKSIKSCDVLISGGGSLLQESTSKMSIFYYLFIYFVALICKKKIVIYSHGIGPVYRKFTKSLIRFIFKRASSISVRDLNSKTELISYGVAEEAIDVTADPVIGFKKFGKEKGYSILDKTSHNRAIPTIGMSIKGSKEKCVVDEFVEIIDKLKAQRCNIVLVPFHQTEDQKIMKDINEQSAHELIIIDKKHSVEEVFSLIECFDVLVGVRLHALIFAAVAETPVVGISYDPKIDAFLQSIGEKAIGKINALDTQKTVDSIMNTIEQNKEKKHQLNLAVFKHKLQLTKYNSNIEKMLD